MDVRFHQTHPWSLIPQKRKIAIKQAEEDARLYALNFRWFRRTRDRALCWPQRVSQEIGWVIPSPVDVLVAPLHDVEVVVPTLERAHFSQSTGLTEFAPQGEETQIASEASWLKLYDVKFHEKWDAMFAPLGEGFVEWRLGWQAEIPPDYALLVLPLPDLPGVEVPYSLLSHNQVAQMNQERGLCVAFRPQVEVMLRRRQPIAQLLLIHPATLQVRTRFEAAASSE